MNILGGSKFFIFKQKSVGGRVVVGTITEIEERCLQKVFHQNHISTKHKFVRFRYKIWKFFTFNPSLLKKNEDVEGNRVKLYDKL